MSGFVGGNCRDSNLIPPERRAAEMTTQIDGSTYTVHPAIVFVTTTGEKPYVVIRYFPSAAGFFLGFLLALAVTIIRCRRKI